MLPVSRHSREFSWDNEKTLLYKAVTLCVILWKIAR